MTLNIVQYLAILKEVYNISILFVYKLSIYNIKLRFQELYIDSQYLYQYLYSLLFSSKYNYYYTSFFEVIYRLLDRALLTNLLYLKYIDRQLTKLLLLYSRQSLVYIFLYNLFNRLLITQLIALSTILTFFYIYNRQQGSINRSLIILV